MPILQSRVLALISAGRDYQRALRRLQRLITEAGRDESPATALQRLAMDSQEIFLLSHPLESGKILDMEEEKLRPVVLTRNEKAKARIAKLRRTGKIHSEAKGPQQEGRLQTPPSYGVTAARAAEINEEGRQLQRTAKKTESEGDGGMSLVEAEEGQSTDD